MEKKSYFVKEIISNCRKDKTILERFIELVETNKDIKTCHKCNGNGVCTKVAYEPSLYTFSNFEIYANDLKLNSEICDICKGLGLIEDNITLKGITK